MFSIIVNSPSSNAIFDESVAIGPLDITGTSLTKIGNKTQLYLVKYTDLFFHGVVLLFCCR